MDVLSKAACTTALIGLHAAYALLDAVTLPPPAAASIRSRQLDPRKTPRHVAFALIDDESPEDEDDETLDRLRRIIIWASEMRIAELSLWSDRGLVESATPHLLADLASHPETPPSSSGSSAGGSSSSPCSSRAELPRSSCSSSSSPRVTSFTYWQPDAEGDHRSSRGGLGMMTVHLLPQQDGKGWMVDAARKAATAAAASHSNPRAIDVEGLDQIVRSSLHFETDPDLLIVQASSGSRPRAASRAWITKLLLPSSPPPPELHGFPFWPLRITEIYHVTPPPPTTSERTGTFSLSPLASSRRSYLDETDSTTTSPAVSSADREAWDHAIGRWQRVEQRLGR